MLINVWKMGFCTKNQTLNVLAIFQAISDVTIADTLFLKMLWKTKQT